MPTTSQSVDGPFRCDFIHVPCAHPTFESAGSCPPRRTPAWTNPAISALKSGSAPGPRRSEPERANRRMSSGGSRRWLRPAGTLRSRRSPRLVAVSFDAVDAGFGLPLPSAPQRSVQLDHGGELIPCGRGELQLCAEELALDVKDLELGGESTVVAKRDHRERPAVRRHAALALRADVPHLAVRDQGVLDFAERLLDRLQVLEGRLLLSRLKALNGVLDPPCGKERNSHGGDRRTKPGAPRGEGGPRHALDAPHSPERDLLEGFRPFPTDSRVCGRPRLSCLRDMLPAL